MKETKKLRNFIFKILRCFAILLLCECSSAAEDIYFGCGQSSRSEGKGCFGLPANCVSKGKNCELLVTFHKSENGDQFDLELMATNINKPGNGYVAVGFSENMKMDSDSVIVCLSANGKTEVQEWYIPTTDSRTVKPVNRTQENSIFRKGSNSREENGIITCKFSIGSRIDLMNLIDKTFDLDTEELFLLLAAGGYDASQSRHSGLGYHSTKDSSKTKISLKDHVIVDEYSCGSTAGCFALPQGCVVGDDQSHNCQLFVKYHSRITSEEEGARYEFELSGKKVGSVATEGYVAVGISDDNQMESDAVFGCYLDGHRVTVGEFFNKNGARGNAAVTSAEDEKAILPGTTSSYENGIITCKFAIKSIVNITKDVGNIFNLKSEKFYLLLARGPKGRTGPLGYHENPEDKGVSSKAKYLHGPYGGTDDGLLDYIDCGVESKSEQHKGCFGIPRNCIYNKNCEYFVKYFPKTQKKSNNTLLHFELIGRKIGKSATTGYIAVGFSDNGQMNADSVFGCFLSDSSVEIGEFFNMKDTKANQGVKRRDNEEVIVKQGSSGSIEDGTIRCEFAVKPMINLTDHGGGVYNLLDDNVFILLSRGDSASSGGLGKHPSISDRGVTENSVLLREPKIAEEQSTIGIEIHGLLLIISWVFLAPVGMFTARYFKQTFTDFKPNRKAFWFGFHQLCMFLTMAFTVIGIITIFLHVKGYSDEGRNDPAQKYHPILGFLVLALTLLQVLISFFRPEPNARKRYIFNWIHWTMGTSAHILAIACIYLANNLKKTNLKGQERYWHVTTFFIVFHISMHFIMTYITRYCDRKNETENEFRAFFPGPMRTTGDSTEIEGTAFRAIILVLEILGTAIASTLLCTFVFDSL